jgi:chemosensory pili system protein ChpA (sensor histidine kinase/response regulator)
MMTEAEHQKRVRELFREEALEHLDAIHNALDAAGAGGDAAKSALKDALRAAHSLKGGAAIAGMTTMQAMVHNWESCAGFVVSGRTAWSG